MKKLALSMIAITALLISCKSNSNARDTKKLYIAFESKSNSSVTGTASFIEKTAKSLLLLKSLD